LKTTTPFSVLKPAAADSIQRTVSSGYFVLIWEDLSWLTSKRSAMYTFFLIEEYDHNAFFQEAHYGNSIQKIAVI